MQAYPLLDELFRGREKLYAHIGDDDPYGVIRSEAEQLLEWTRRMGISGTKKLARNVGSSTKFAYLLAELRFALLLAEIGGSVELLQDEEFGPRVYTPDLHVVFPGNIPALVEVTRRSSGSPDVSTSLHEAIKDAGLPFRVEYTIGAQLSVPVPDGRGRKDNEQLLTDVVQQAINGLLIAYANSWSHGVVHIRRRAANLYHEIQHGRTERLPLRDDVPCQHGEDWMGSVVFGPSPIGEGYSAGGLSSVHIYDGTHRAKFLEDVRRKAGRRKDILQAHASTPFLVAVQNDEHELTPTDVLSALTGSRCAYVGSAAGRERWLHERPSGHPPAVKAAVCAGWGALLTEWDYGSGAQVRLTDFGAYLQTDDPWAQNLSGVIVMHHGGNLVQWLPNPFAAPEINDSRLLRIGLPLDKLGAPSTRASARS